MRRPATGGRRIRFQANRLALGAECDAFSIVSEGKPDVKNRRSAHIAPFMRLGNAPEIELTAGMDWMAKSDKNVTNPLITFRKEVKKPIDCFRIKSNQKEAKH